MEESAAKGRSLVISEDGEVKKVPAKDLLPRVFDPGEDVCQYRFLAIQRSFAKAMVPGSGNNLSYFSLLVPEVSGRTSRVNR